MARVAHREGYPEIGLYWEKAAWEEAEHAAKFAELLGEVVTDSTKKNLEMRVEAENGATAGKFDLAKRAKAANLDAIHDTVHEMARDEARHGRAFEGLLKSCLLYTSLMDAGVLRFIVLRLSHLCLSFSKCICLGITDVAVACPDLHPVSSLLDHYHVI